MKKKKAVKGVIIVLVIFVLINVIWGVYTFFKWKPYCDAVGYDENSKMFTCFEGERGQAGRYVYTVSLPGYLRFGGNLGVSETSYSGIGRPTMQAIIFPESEGYQIVVRFVNYSAGEEENAMQKTGEIVLNEKMEYYNEPSEHEKELYDCYKEDVEVLFGKIDEKWGIH